MSASKNPKSRPPRVRRNVTPEVGYGRPPRASQFKPGQSGNLKGRPKGSKNESTILHDVLNRKVAVREAGGSRKISILEAILLRVVEDCLKGNTKSAAFVLNRYGTMVSGEIQQPELSADDREILEDFARRHGNNKPKVLS